MRHGQELKHHRASRRIGRWWRKIFNKRKFKRLLEATLVLQSYVRRWQAQRIVFQLRFERDIAIHQKKRTNIVQEILQTEENYVRDLDTLVKVFFFFLKKKEIILFGSLAHCLPLARSS